MRLFVERQRLCRRSRSVKYQLDINVINMADAVARREARRKRILENSENRLQSITGSNIAVRGDKSANSCTPSKPEAKDPDYETLPVTDAHPNSHAEPQLGHLVDETYLGDDDILTRSLSNNDLRKRNINSRATNHAVRSNERFSPNERQPNTINKATNESDQEVNTHDSIRRLSTQTSLSCSVFASRWLLVLLAAFVNVLYILQLQHLCRKTILAPFFALTLIRLNLADSKSEGQGGSMLSAALILCNIRPELVYNLRWVTKTVRKITEEFAIYIFSFVIIYNASYSYWNDIDMTISVINPRNNDGLQ